MADEDMDAKTKHLYYFFLISFQTTSLGCAIAHQLHSLNVTNSVTMACIYLCQWLLTIFRKLLRWMDREMAKVIPTGPGWSWTGRQFSTSTAKDTKDWTTLASEIPPFSCVGDRTLLGVMGVLIGNGEELPTWCSISFSVMGFMWQLHQQARRTAHAKQVVCSKNYLWHHFSQNLFTNIVCNLLTDRLINLFTRGLHALVNAGRLRWFEFLVIFDFLASLNKRRWEASSVKIA